MNTTSKKPKYKEVYRVTDIGIHGFFEEHRFLSNFHLCPIWFENREYPSTENSYQAAKFPNSLRQQFQVCTPNEAKKLGQTLKMNRDQIHKWDQKKLDVMREVCESKFKHKAEREMLLATGDKYLEETNQVLMYQLKQYTYDQATDIHHEQFRGMQFVFSPLNR